MESEGDDAGLTVDSNGEGDVKGDDRGQSRVTRGVRELVRGVEAGAAFFGACPAA
jgi:hypothetical protein